MMYRTVLRQIFEKYTAEEIVELRKIFSSDLPRELKAEMLQYMIGGYFREPCEKFLRKYEDLLVKDMR